MLPILAPIMITLMFVIHWGFQAMVSMGDTDKRKFYITIMDLVYLIFTIAIISYVCDKILQRHEKKSFVDLQQLQSIHNTNLERMTMTQAMTQ